MRDFTFYNPTRIEFGKSKEVNIGQYVKEFGVDSVLVLYGSERIKKDGLFVRVATCKFPQLARQNVEDIFRLN